jgi:ParB/RepB/Spo0J family partition protein
MASVPVSGIERDDNRKYGSGGAGYAELKRSIERYGMIEPPVVESDESGSKYRVIAGRRRIAAAAELGWKEVDCVVRETGGKGDELALAENVNRAEMHPLEEAEVFSKMLAAGEDVREVAAVFSRGVSGVYQRARLNGLTDGIKELYRGGKIKLAAAALLAGLDDDAQEKFYEKRKDGGGVITVRDAERYAHSVNKLDVGFLGNEKCAGCRKRTCHGDAELFEDAEYLSDVCFDAACYGKMLLELLGRRIEEYRARGGVVSNTLVLDRKRLKLLPYEGTIELEINGEPYRFMDRGKTEKEYDIKNGGTSGGKNKALYFMVNGEDSYMREVRLAKKKKDKGAAAGGSAAAADSDGSRWKRMPERILKLARGRLAADAEGKTNYIKAAFDNYGVLFSGEYESRGEALSEFLEMARLEEADIELTEKSEKMTAVNNVFKFFCRSSLDLWAVPEPGGFEAASDNPDTRLFFSVLNVTRKEYEEMYEAAEREEEAADG